MPKDTIYNQFFAKLSVHVATMLVYPLNKVPFLCLNIHKSALPPPPENVQVLGLYWNEQMFKEKLQRKIFRNLRDPL